MVRLWFILNVSNACNWWKINWIILHVRLDGSVVVLALMFKIQCTLVSQHWVYKLETTNMFWKWWELIRSDQLGLDRKENRSFANISVCGWMKDLLVTCKGLELNTFRRPTQESLTGWSYHQPWLPWIKVILSRHIISGNPGSIVIL